MKDWVPFLQGLIWPFFLSIIIIIIRKPISILLSAIEHRLKEGAEFEAGTSGIRLGAVQHVESILDRDKKEKSDNLISNSKIIKPSTIYLVHKSKIDLTNKDSKQKWYSISLFLDADKSSELDNVKEVIYYLHPTFEDQIVTTKNRSDSFNIDIKVWGQFNVAAKITFKDGKVMHLERYLNF
jgi:hypothetical protein